MREYRLMWKIANKNATQSNRKLYQTIAKVFLVIVSFSYRTKAKLSFKWMNTKFIWIKGSYEWFQWIVINTTAHMRCKSPKLAEVDNCTNASVIHALESRFSIKIPIESNISFTAMCCHSLMPTKCEKTVLDSIRQYEHCMNVWEKDSLKYNFVFHK